MQENIYMSKQTKQTMAPTVSERSVINDLRALDDDATMEFCSQIARMAMLQRAKNHTNEQSFV